MSQRFNSEDTITYFISTFDCRDDWDLLTHVWLYFMIKWKLYFNKLYETGLVFKKKLFLFFNKVIYNLF